MALITCKECGKEISDKAERCPNCGCPIAPQPQARQVTSPPPVIVNAAPQKKKGSCLKSILIVFGVLILLGIIGSALGGNDKEDEPTPPPADESVPEESEDVAGPEVTEKDTASGEVKDKYHVGETWENKHVLVSYDACGEYESTNQFIQPAEGNKYIYASFTFENIGSSDTTIGYWDFDCYADGYACEASYGADDAGFTQTLSAGRKITGSVYFEVPEDAGEIEIEFSPNSWTSEKIVFIYE